MYHRYNSSQVETLIGNCIEQSILKFSSLPILLLISYLSETFK